MKVVWCMQFDVILSAVSYLQQLQYHNYCAVPRPVEYCDNSALHRHVEIVKLDRFSKRCLMFTLPLVCISLFRVFLVQ